MGQHPDITAYPEVFERLPVRRESMRGGWDIPCPVLHNHKHADKRWSGRIWVDGDRLRFWCGRGCKWSEANAALGLDSTAWFENKGKGELRTMSGSTEKRAPEIVATYNYYDFWSGEKRLAYQVIRTNPKGFYQRRPAPDGQGWVYNMGECWTWFDGHRWQSKALRDAKGNESPKPAESAVQMMEVRRVPYNLSDIRSRANHPILVVEGEKSADLLGQLGYLATCSPGGAGKWPAGFGGYLSKRRVVIFPDNDEPGMGHAALVAGSAVLYGADSVRIARPGNLGFELADGEDIWDWIMRIGRAEEGELMLTQKRREAINKLVRQLPEFTWKAGEVIKEEVRTHVTVVKGEKKKTRQNFAKQKEKAALIDDPVHG